MRALKLAKIGERWMLIGLVCGLGLVFAQLCVLVADGGKPVQVVPELRKTVVALSSKVDHTLRRIGSRF